jgi:hypothetical protein
MPSDVSARRHDASGPGISLFGMLFEISDRLAQAFRVDLVWLGLGRGRCIPCAGLFFPPLGFRLVILIHPTHHRLMRDSYEALKIKWGSPVSGFARAIT